MAKLPRFERIQRYFSASDGFVVGWRCCPLRELSTVPSRMCGERAGALNRGSLVMGPLKLAARVGRLSDQAC